MNSINDIQRRKINMFLVADNMEDESQMDLAVHGELAGKIVQQIFEQVFLPFFFPFLSFPWIILSQYAIPYISKIVRCKKIKI